MFKAITLKHLFSPTAAVLIISLLVWALGLPTWIKYAHAANVTSYKDTLTDSDLSVLSKHSLSFTLANTVTSSSTIKITFDSATSLFTPGFSSATTTDITVTGMTLVTSCGVGSDEVTVTGTGNTGSNEGYTFTVCSTDTVTTGAKTITIGAVTNLVTNPGVSASYVIRLGGTMTDSGDTRVAIIDDVTVTASVDTTLTFTISGVASGQANANDPGVTSITTTATTIPWGTLGIGTASSTARQDLAVTTNATNGFTVTVWQDQNLTSSTGADIDIFKDGTNGSPAAWTAPAGTLDSEATYGHEGITSEDATLSGGDTFGTALYDAVGSSTSRLPVFYHTGPADGTTADKGATKIGFKIQINALQEAGTDYTQALTYIATPTF